jgi:hypothetical protein
MIRFWRDESFDGLASLSSLLGTDPRLEHLAVYCDLREKGLRPQAFRELNTFLKQIHSRDTQVQREVALFILDAAWNRPQVYEFISHPLQNGFLEPVLKEWWAVEPANPVPIRYYALLRDDYRLLKEALPLNPDDNSVRAAIVKLLIRFVDFATHHLIEGLFIGDEAEAFDDMIEADTILEGMTDSALKISLRRHVEDLSLLLADWRQYQVAPDGTFRDWCSKQNHHHRWWNIVYYNE